MLAVDEGLGEAAFERAAIVGLPNQIAQRDAITNQMALDARSENGAGSSVTRLRESPEQ